MASERNSIIISVFSTSSGNGKTITAINLAAGLNREGYAVCLIDLDLQFGDIVTYLKLNPKHSIGEAQLDFIENNGKINVIDYLTEYVNVNENGDSVEFSVMAPPSKVFDAYNIEVGFVEKLIRQMNYFDFIILDLSAVFSSLNLAMLDMSTIINYVGVVDFLPSVKNFKVGYDTLIRFEYEGSKIRLVENRANSQKLISGQDVERLIGEKFFHRLPNDFPSVSKSVREGRPLMFAAPNSALTKSFTELARKYTRHQEHAPQEIVTPEKHNQGIIPRVFNAFFG
ncbi:MAG: AAA family ATPase [Selenomonadaceae bacterium]|nr:AAA family ATPase [Selenomonadaceae bacterium]